MNRLFGSVGKAVLVFAVVVGIVGRLRPHYFFYVPRIGFLFYLATTGRVPRTIDPDAWTPQESFRRWIKPKDVIVAAGGKSGTNWMLYCTHQIRMHEHLELADELFFDVNYATPWPDYRQNPGMSWKDEFELYRSFGIPSKNHTPYAHYWDNELYPFRVFKSHGFPVDSKNITQGFLHVRENPDIRFIAMARNGLDVMASYAPFFKKIDRKALDLRGGFPPPMPTFETHEEDIDYVLDLFLGDAMRYHNPQSHFKYVGGWWQARNEPNVLLLHYSDALKDLAGTVSKMAKFLNIGLTRQQESIIRKRCGFAHMKQIDDKFAYRLPLNKRFGEFKVFAKGGIVNRGGTGHGQREFTPEQVQRFLDAEEKDYGGDQVLIDWARKGGPLPP